MCLGWMTAWRVLRAPPLETTSRSRPPARLQATPRQPSNTKRCASVVLQYIERGSDAVLLASAVMYHRLKSSEEISAIWQQKVKPAFLSHLAGCTGHKIEFM